VLVLVLGWSIDVGWPVRLAAVALLGVVLTYYYSLYFQEREVVLDWARNEARFRRGNSTRTFTLGDAREVVVRGWSGGASRRLPSYRMYWCEAELRFATGTGLLLSTDPSTDPDVPYRPMLSLAVELARALGVPWRWVTYATAAPGGAILDGRA
jgi:hypothetical protein